MPSNGQTAVKMGTTRQMPRLGQFSSEEAESSSLTSLMAYAQNKVFRVFILALVFKYRPFEIKVKQEHLP